MCTGPQRLLAVGLIVCASTLIGEISPKVVVANAAVAAAEELVQTELSIGGRTIKLTYALGLRADDPANRAVLSMGPSDTKVRVARLETRGAVRLGTVDLGSDVLDRLRPELPDAYYSQVSTYDLWVESTDAGWEIQVTGLSDSDEAAGVVGQVVMARHDAEVVSPTFVGALFPTDELTGKLVVRWGEYEAATVMEVAPPLRRRQGDGRIPNVPILRSNIEDLSLLFQVRMLRAKNEAALVFADGGRVSVTFARRGLKLDDPDFASIMTCAEGAVLKLTETSVPRLRTDRAIRFGDATIRSGNQSPGVTGAYSIWLKRVSNGWRLVFNHESDIWGSQHDPAFDAGEVDLTHSKGESASESFGVSLVPKGADGGRLVIVWGPHEWATDFVLSS